MRLVDEVKPLAGSSFSGSLKEYDRKKQKKLEEIKERIVENKKQ